MTTEDRRRGKLLPSPVTPSGTVCFSIVVPNAVQYRAALLGQLLILGDWHTWDHPIDGTVCVDCEEAAQLWRNAIQGATWSDECGGVDPMSCEDVADCIENNPATINAIQNIVSNQVLPGQYATPGQAMSTAQSSAPLNPAPVDCNPDVLWAQCEQLVNYLVDGARDTLEYIETYSNSVEGAQFIELAPFLGTIIDEAQIDKALEFINWAQENVKEYFEAADTTSNRQQIACSIFCACLDDCEITVDRIWGTINARLGGILNPSAIDDLDSLIDAFLTLSGSNTIALDAALVIVVGFAKFAGYLGVKGIDKTINLVLKVAMNDANNDWQLLCECAPAPGFMVYGTLGQTSVVQSGNTYTITGGFIGGGGATYLYVAGSLDGTPTSSVALAYSSLQVIGEQYFDWGNSGGNYITEPPLSAPPPQVNYAGGLVMPGQPDTLSIVIETEMPFQGIVQGS